MPSTRLAIIALFTGLVPAAHAQTVISRFDAGPEGWTVEGSGTIEWVPDGRIGGAIKVTRTGEGEVFLVGPAAFASSCQATPLLRLNFSIRTDRAALRPIRTVWATTHGDLTHDAPIGCTGCWFPGLAWVFASEPSQFTGIRIRVGVDPGLPVGEVTIIDDVEFRTSAANCDGSTAPPVLNVNDFQCFLNMFAAGDPYANMNGSSIAPFLNANDFQTFLGAYAAGDVGCP